MRIFCFVFFLVVSMGSAFADETPVSTVPASSGRVSTAESEARPWHFKLSTESSGYEFVVTGRDSGQSLTFDPSTLASLKISVSNYNYFGLSIAFGLNPSRSDLEKKGTSDYTDLRLTIVKKNWVLRANFSEFKSFYVVNSQSADPTWNASQPYVQLPSLFARSLGVNFTYVFSPEKFSLPALETQEARQTASGGSWLAGILFRRDKFGQGSSVIPTAVRTNYGSDGAFSTAQFGSLGLRGGYGYQFNFNKSFFIAGQIQFGLGLVRTQVGGPSLGYAQTRPASAYDVEVAIGYNGEIHYWGLSAYSSNAVYETKSLDFKSTLLQSSLYYGFRL